MTTIILLIIAVLVIAAVAHYAALPSRYDPRRDK